MIQEYLSKSILLLLLAALARTDIRTRQIPVTGLLLSGIAGAGIYLLSHPYSSANLLGGMAVGGGLLLFSLASRGSLGRGDGYLFGITGIYLGFWQNMALLLLALLLSAAVAVLLLAGKRCGRRQRLPFVPFVLAADVILLI